MVGPKLAASLGRAAVRRRAGRARCSIFIVRAGRGALRPDAPCCSGCWRARIRTTAGRTGRSASCSAGRRWRSSPTCCSARSTSSSSTWWWRARSWACPPRTRVLRLRPELQPLRDDAVRAASRTSSAWPRPAPTQHRPRSSRMIPPTRRCGRIRDSTRAQGRCPAPLARAGRHPGAAAQQPDPPAHPGSRFRGPAGCRRAGLRSLSPAPSERPLPSGLSARRAGRATGRPRPASRG